MYLQDDTFGKLLMRHARRLTRQSSSKHHGRPGPDHGHSRNFNILNFTIASYSKFETIYLTQNSSSSKFLDVRRILQTDYAPINPNWLARFHRLTGREIPQTPNRLKCQLLRTDLPPDPQTDLPPESTFVWPPDTVRLHTLNGRQISHIDWMSDVPDWPSDSTYCMAGKIVYIL